MQHCFIVDDSDIIRRFTRLIFENLDFRVSEAENPANAIERLKTMAWRRYKSTADLRESKGPEERSTGPLHV